MYVINIEDVNNILMRYKLEQDKSVISVEILQYYQIEKRLCMVLLIETILKKKYVIKILSNEAICVQREEKQAEFSEFLRGNGIPVPCKYKIKDKYVDFLNFLDIKVSITVEEYWGENLDTISLESTITLGKLLADMHEVVITHAYHLSKGSTYRALFSEKVGIDKIWDKSQRNLVEPVVYEKIKQVHEEATSKLKKMWEKLPIYAVHGDLGLISNITIHNNQYGIIDFNLAGDEVLLNDMLVTWYSSVYTLKVALCLSQKERIEYREEFFKAYIKNRNLTIEEQAYLYDMACIINGVYFNRFTVMLASKGFYNTVKKMVLHISDNYYQLDSDIDIQSELKKEIYYI